MRAFVPLLLLLAAAAPAQTRYEWAGGSAGDWSDPANWSPNGVPAAADTAVVGALNQGERIVTLTEATVVAGFELVRLGGIDGDFDLTVTDRFTWGTAGFGFEPIRGSGTVTTGPAATLRVTENATLLRVGPGRTLVNEGLLAWEAPVQWDGQGRIVNEGEIDLAFDGPDDFNLAFSSLADAITNTADGVIRRTGTGDARYLAGLVNDGLVRIENGSLDLRGFGSAGATGSGSIEVEPGGTLIVGSGNHTQSSVTGEALTFRSGNGRLTVADGYDIATTHFDQRGRLVLNTEGTTDTYVQSGGTLDGSGTLTVTGSLEWSGGGMEGSGTTVLGPTIPLTIGGDATVSLGGTRTLRTEGPVTWTGDADLSSGTNTSVFENAGTLTSSGPGERRANFLTVRNTGTVVHTGGTLDFATRMDNEGTVRAEGGTLRLRATGSVDAGTYTVNEAGLLSIAGSRTLTETARVEGTGTVVFENGADVTNRAAWRPGASPGILSVDSDWPGLAPEGVLDVEIGGPVAGTDFDQLAVAGEATLGGTLRVTLTGGFAPADGDRFLIVPAEGVVGGFDALDLPDGLEAYVDVAAEGAELVIGQRVAGEGEAAGLPTVPALHAPYPNPAPGAAAVGFDLPEPARVRLAVYDVLGRAVAVLVDAERPAGRHTARLDVEGLATGLYLVRLEAGDGTYVRRIVVAR